MTEAAHQMASNPLPPGERRPGTVGVATGTEIAILDDDWQSLPAGAVGEVAVRGPGVVDGYRETRRRTPPPSATAGSAPATPARSTTPATSTSPAGSRS